MKKQTIIKSKTTKMKTIRASSCGYQWEDDLVSFANTECGGHHECILQPEEDHPHTEHECACGSEQDTIV